KDQCHHDLSLNSALITRAVSFIFNAATRTKIYTLSLHDALPIFSHPDNGDDSLYPDKCGSFTKCLPHDSFGRVNLSAYQSQALGDRKSTRLNSSHRTISYAVFCLKKKIRLTQTLQKSE